MSSSLRWDADSMGSSLLTPPTPHPHCQSFGPGHKLAHAKVTTGGCASFPK